MCGINGLYSKSNINLNDVIRKMNYGLQHRGPDDEGIYADERVALGHKRLSIIDLSSSGKQPMINTTDEFIITYNGELYNYLELKKELFEYPFKTHTDTEVVLAAYIKWGKACLEKFNGMFAFAIWDKINQKLFIARDRLGIKPLYYHHSDDVFLFSSEIRPILKSGLVSKTLNRSGLSTYLNYQTIYGPQTILNEIKYLESGHYLEFANNSISVQKYWSPIRNISSPKNYTEAKNDTYKLLFSAVQKRLVSDVPFGAFLSGGIDSSVIVALMNQIIPGKINTFSITFAEQEFSEALYSNLIAKKYNTHHHEINLSPDDFLNLVPDALNSMDHPSGDGLNTYVISKAVKEKGITVALSGLGGDELFAGYNIFNRMQHIKNNNWLWSTPLLMRKFIGTILKKVKPGVSTNKLYDLLLTDGSFAEAYWEMRKLFPNMLLKNLGVNLSNNNKIELDTNFPILGKTSVSELSTYMQHVLLRDADQMGMAHALEIRVPFLDHQLVEYVVNLPDQFKQSTTPKKLLTDALGDLIPPEIIHRPKMGFVLPWEHWMKNELYDLCNKSINSFSNRGLVNKESLLRLWSAFNAGSKHTNWTRLWIFVVLEHWLQKNGVEE